MAAGLADAGTQRWLSDMSEWGQRIRSHNLHHRRRIREASEVEVDTLMTHRPDLELQIAGFFHEILLSDSVSSPATALRGSVIFNVIRICSSDLRKRAYLALCL